MQQMCSEALMTLTDNTGFLLKLNILVFLVWIGSNFKMLKNSTKYWHYKWKKQTTCICFQNVEATYIQYLVMSFLL